MEVKVIKDCIYSHDKVNITSLKVGDICVVPDDIGKAFVSHGWCEYTKKKAKPAQDNNFNPVEETKAPKRRKGKRIK